MAFIQRRCHIRISVSRRENQEDPEWELLGKSPWGIAPNPPFWMCCLVWGTLLHLHIYDKSRKLKPGVFLFRQKSCSAPLPAYYPGVYIKQKHMLEFKNFSNTSCDLLPFRSYHKNYLELCFCIYCPNTTTKKITLYLFLRQDDEGRYTLTYCDVF
jgi:hypothetical protein